MISAWWGDLRRRALLSKAPEGALKRYLGTPWPAPHLDYRAVDYLALDFETTGLKPKRDAVVSFGYLPLGGSRIRLSGANYSLVQTSQPVEQSATIHGLFDDAVAAGLESKVALDTVLTALTGRVLLVHYAPIELSFLNALCRYHYGLPFVARVVDTLALARRRQARRAEPLDAEALRLYTLRERYDLPRYKSHNALADALATAELFLALAAERAGDRALTLERLLY